MSNETLGNKKVNIACDNATRLEFGFFEKDVKEAIKKLEDLLYLRLKLYEMKLTMNGETITLREHEKRKLIKEIVDKQFGEKLT